MFGRGPLVRTCLAASILLMFAERGAAQVSGPYVSPQFPAKRVHVDPESARPTPSAAVKHVPEGGEHEPSQPPPRKLKEPDPTIQLSSKDAPFEAQVGEAPSPNSMTAPLVNVPGIQSNAFPPDTVGDIGRNHYIQMTNAASSGGQTVFEIFDKTGNDLSGGPVRFGGLWPVGDACRSDLGDPIVVYDHLADRWLLSQFAGDPNNPTTVPAFMCIAISQTPNPTANSWFLYTILLPRFADYPKFGVWPDAYYMSSYEGANLGVFAFDRLSMLTGSATSFRKFTIGSLGTATVRDTRILPADLDGPAPAPGTPNFFVRPVDQQQDPVGVDRVEIYEFQANFAANTFNFAFLAAGLLLHGNPRSFLRAVSRASPLRSR